tara:strand:- start:21856 stop:22734 length:879 start_codon:yes stop_codon:yes gene_type:complete
MSKRKTTEDFVFSAIEKHGNRYDYSTSNYIDARTKIEIVCKEHGSFRQIPRHHISGYDCPKCSGTYMDTEYFTSKSKNIHKDFYDYSKVVYTTNVDKVTIICPNHGEFEQKPKDHLLGKNCQKCAGTYMDTEHFVYKSNIVHNHKYDYTDTNYSNAISKVKITCPKHGEFNQTPNSHLGGKGCPTCKESKGEKKIRRILEKYNINYIPQHTFDDCKNIRPLPFDFYLSDLNTCIEYNGIQHYKPIKYFGGENKLVRTKYNDSVKYNYCKSNRIGLLVLTERNINDLIKLISD